MCSLSLDSFKAMSASVLSVLMPTVIFLLKNLKYQIKLDKSSSAK